MYFWMTVFTFIQWYKGTHYIYTYTYIHIIFITNRSWHTIYNICIDIYIYTYIWQTDIYTYIYIYTNNVYTHIYLHVRLSNAIIIHLYMSTYMYVYINVFVDTLFQKVRLSLKGDCWSCWSVNYELWRAEGKRPCGCWKRIPSWAGWVCDFVSSCCDWVAGSRSWGFFIYIYIQWTHVYTYMCRCHV